MALSWNIVRIIDYIYHEWTQSAGSIDSLHYTKKILIHEKKKKKKLQVIDLEKNLLYYTFMEYSAYN